MPRGYQPMRPGTRERLFWNKVKKDAPNGCWDWQGKTNRQGYGIVTWENKDCRTHRVAYELLIGKIPDGLTLDHLCKNRICVNPKHLEPVTLTENSLRGESPLARKARQETCVNGHPLIGENLHIRPDGHRHCRQCGKERQRLYRSKGQVK